MGILFNRQINYRVMFVRMENNTYGVVKFKPLNKTTMRVKFRDKLFLINPQYPAYRRKSRIYYMVDIDNGQVTTLNNIQLPNPVMARTLFKNEALKQLVAGMEANALNAQTLIFILLGVGLGLAVGFIMGQNTIPEVQP